MSWATDYIAALTAGQTVKFRPKGNSMAGRIASGDLVTVVPRGERRPQKGDIVLCKVKGRQYLHLVIGGERTRIHSSLAIIEAARMVGRI